jgi:hypothetical protein
MFSMGVAVSILGCGDAGSDTTGSGGGATGTGGGTTTSSAGGGTPCGTETCTPTEYCGFEPGTCSGAKACHALPGECSELACGCDGVNYAGDCAALSESGGTTSVGEACAPPDGKFTCNYEYQIPIYCDLDTEYCKVIPGGTLYSLSCEPVPEGCVPDPLDCACLNDPCSDNYCGVDADTHAATVLCPL